MATYNELKEHLGNDLCAAGEIDGEVCTLERNGDAMKLSYFQDNGWIRAHYYYEDGTVCESYERTC